MVDIKPSGVGLSLDALREFESEMGVQFERDYREFLRRYNGGIPENNVVRLMHGDIETISVTSLFGLGLDNEDDLRRILIAFRGRIPNGYLPIGRVEGGNLICMSFRKETQWQLFLWDHDIELLLEEEQGRSLQPVAPSFSAFLDSMNAGTGSQESASYKVEEAWIDPDFLKQFSEE